MNSLPVYEDRLQPAPGQALILAHELGAAHTIDNRHEEVASRLSAITGGAVDYVLEITGDRTLHRVAISVLNPHGTVAYLTGVSGPHPLS